MSIESQMKNRTCLPVVYRGCCCDLKTCCTIQGWFLIISSTLSAIRSILNLALSAGMCSNIDSENHYQYDCWSDRTLMTELRAIFVFDVVNIIVQVAFLAAAILFLQGIAKTQPAKMVHYIRLLWVEITITSILIMLGALIAPLVFILFIFMGVPVYCLICANSLRLKMEETRTLQNTVA